ncbi:outer membrane lipoprotein carrier protein LolA [Oceaniovalibus sp. ACAM 378]|uniref:LolA family protein n=1 Tax=Oceaniovalibus sp. ACAM 378 TaxID=2599923 RepID=UPI0011D30D4F|nr:outer membrane lipoprotein carrier protein LolA [Oceaniovalibus sp. ACAM 378]TYB89147.1 outer membrane lipoprotein carrier protein LolA [Oceaniovalibus sp. ACAM 378]
MFTRRTFIAGASAASVLALMGAPAQAAKLSLNELSAYLNRLQTAQSDFTQINDDGTISTGRIYIKRPGRCRFDYNPPEKTLVMVGGGQVAIFDAKSNAIEPEQYPLSRTPLNIILEKNVDFARRDMVVGHREDGPKTVVVAQDPANPDYGKIELVFTGNPVQLRQWIITDGAGSRTTVILGELKTGGNLSSTLFNIPYEVGQRKG